MSQSRGMRMALAVAALVIAIVALAWLSGAVTARVTVTQRSHQFFEEAGRGEVVFHLHNRGVVPLDVRSVFLQPERGWVRELSADSLRLGPRESGELVVIYRVDCELWDSTQLAAPIGVEASALVGSTHRSAIRLSDAIETCEAN